MPEAEKIFGRLSVTSDFFIPFSKTRVSASSLCGEMGTFSYPTGCFLINQGPTMMGLSAPGDKRKPEITTPARRGLWEEGKDGGSGDN